MSWTELFGQVRYDTQAAFRSFKQAVLKQDSRGMDRGLRESMQRQLDQVPEAFAFRRAGWTSRRRQEYFAPNIGIQFRLVPARRSIKRPIDEELQRRATPGPPGLELEPGDTIYLLDSLPIRMAVDLMNHHARTDVVFLNVRTKRPQTGVMNLPGHTPLPADVPPELFAANLGIHYQLMALDGGTFGARLSRTATGDVPAAACGLELGDMIVRLDDQPIKKPEDVLAHFDQTTVDFINIRTGNLERRVVQLPGQAGR